jgi:ergothioneine biosynthesis protein EgtB
MQQLLRSDIDTETASITELGLNHEQQHQELLLTDIKHVFSCNPLLPAVKPLEDVPQSAGSGEISLIEGDAGLVKVGHDGKGFGFDNEFPRHEVLLQPHRLASRLVTNGEFRAFIEEGGYQDAQWWLSDGWAIVQSEGWVRPLYWSQALDAEFTLSGQQAIDPDAPVCHVSLYEADAFARWSGARLPTEYEWEAAAARESVEGNLLETGAWHPLAGGPSRSHRSQFFGDVWEWTSSAYAAYPGFRPLSGSLGEYNGKFMCNQATVRGGSCVTSANHIRASYRSFFYPHQRWQFLGFRLAWDID